MLLVLPAAAETESSDAETTAEDIPAIPAGGYTGTSLIYSLIQSGKYAEAGQVIAEMSSVNYTPALALCSARLAGAQGDTLAALALYAKVNTLGTEDAAAEAALLLQTDSTEYDLVLLAHEDNYCPEVTDRRQVVENARKAASDYAEALAKAITDNAAEKDRELISLVGRIDETYRSLRSFSDGTKKQGEEMYRSLQKITEEDPSLLSLSVVREAQEKALILSQKIKTLLKMVQDGATEQELLDTAELYLRGYIAEKDLSSVYSVGDREKIEAVRAQLKELHMNGESTELRKRARGQYVDLGKKVSKAGFYGMMESMREAAEEGSEYASKLYLEMARLAYGEEEETDAETYLIKAVEAAVESPDLDYKEPLEKIGEVLNGAAAPSGLKMISSQINDAVEQISPLPLTQKEGSQAAPTEQFESFAAGAVSKKTASVLISDVDALKFPEMTLTVTVDGMDPAEAADKLILKDCGKEISNVNVTHLNYSNVNVLLVCDNSGSMSGSPIRSLQTAVNNFVDKAGSKEKIGILTFDNSIIRVLKPTSDFDQVRNLSDSMRAVGGTNIYGAAREAISQMGTGTGDDLNVIILMSDGADGNAQSLDVIRDTVVEPCRNAGILLYTVGIGSADADYLSGYSEGTGGSFLYADDAADIDSFYAFVRGLSQYRFRLGYTAEDTLTVERSVQVSVKDDLYARDIKYYTLTPETEESKAVSRSKGAKKYFLGKVNGLDTRMIYQTSAQTHAILRGEKFKEDEEISITARGPLDYTLPAEFISDTQYRVTIPGNMAVGSYELAVTINGKTAYFQNELTVCSQATTYSFGPYVFTAGRKETGADGTVRLSGFVQLNSWLTFNDEVIIQCYGQDVDYIDVTDLYGSKVSYSLSAGAEGLGKHFAETGKKADLPALNTFRLYWDRTHEPSSDDYKTEAIFILPDIRIVDLMDFSASGIRLYPDRMVINTNEFETKLPFQEKLLQKTGLFKYKLERETKVTLTAKNIGFYLKVGASDFQDYKKNKDAKPLEVKLGNNPIQLKKAEAELLIDTLKPEYSIKVKASLPFIKVGDDDDLGLGLKLGWKDSKCPSEIRIYADFPIKTQIGPVPATFSDFELAVTNINPDKSVLYWTLEGVTDIAVAKLSDYVKVKSGLFANKSITDFIEDASVMTFEDTTVDLCLGEVYLKLNSKAKLFGKVDIGEITVEAGKFNYTNQLLGIYSEQVHGLRAAVAVGPVWKTANCDIELRGTVEADLTSAFIGLDLSGKAKVDVSWWIIHKEAEVDGSCVLGLQFPKTGGARFVLAYGGTNAKGKYKEKVIAWPD